MTSVSQKKWALKSCYDDSDPDAYISESEIIEALGFKKSTIYSHLPAEKFPRKDGYIKGIQLAQPVIIPTYSEAPVVAFTMDDLQEAETEVETEVSEKQLISSSEPAVNLYDLKDLARQANDKVANSYNSRNNHNPSKTYKKRDPSSRLKRDVWNDMFGSLTEALCPVCSRNVIKSDSFELSHILAEKKGGMTIPENLMPACLPCNRGMGQNHLYYYAWYQYGKVLWPVY